MRALYILLSMSFAASVASAGGLQVASVAPTAVAPPATETAPPPAEPTSARDDVTAQTATTTAMATTTASVLVASAAAMAPALTIVSTAAMAVNAASPIDTTTEVADAADDTDGEDIEAAPAARIALPATVPTEQDLVVLYQHVGRDLLKLQDQRGKFDCGGVIPRFKAINLEASLATAASRTQLYVDLTDMSLKIDRLRGIHIDTVCLQNPLASGCM